MVARWAEPPLPIDLHKTVEATAQGRRGDEMSGAIETKSIGGGQALFANRTKGGKKEVDQNPRKLRFLVRL